jgi:hypothetical protein
MAESSETERQGRPPTLCVRCGLARSDGCTHCRCTGHYCLHKDQRCDTSLTAGNNGNICYACRRRSTAGCTAERIKEEISHEISETAPGVPSGSAYSKRKRVTTEADAQWFNLEATMQVEFLNPLRTVPGQLTGKELELVQPFEHLLYEQRSPHPEYGVLLRPAAGALPKKRKHQYITNAIQKGGKGKMEHHILSGYDGYTKVHGCESMTAGGLAAAQHQSTLGFDSSLSMTHCDGWGSWAARLPPYILPGEYQKDNTSARLAHDMEALLLTKLRTAVNQLGHSFDETLRISHAHVLDQNKLGASFRWHRDTEEQHCGRHIKYTMVVLLSMDEQGKTAPMILAGAKEASNYDQVGAFHVFDASLYHSTVESPHGGVKLGVFFAVPW